MECQTLLTGLLNKSSAVQFASLSTVDGRSFAHATAASSTASANRVAAITSSLMGLIESFTKESLDRGALYNTTSTEKGSIVIVRVPSRARHHVLCICSDAGANLAISIRTALDAAEKLSEFIDSNP